jgi:phosphatidylglycerophosphatase A
MGRVPRGDEKRDKDRLRGDLRNLKARLLESPFVRHFVICLSSGFYSGYCPVAPGTVGTIIAIPLHIVISRLSAPSYGIALVVFIVLSWWLSRAAEAVFLEKDSRRIVVDEMAGFLVTMGFLPPVPVYLVTGFILFRFFDIVKPFPIRRLESLEGGFGVVADDLMAGVYSHLALRIAILLF